MNSFVENLERRITNLKKIIKEKEGKLVDVPEGSVQIFQSKGRTQFYRNQNGEVRYMKTEELPVVDRLCQKDYDQKVLSAASQELHALEKIYKSYPEKSYESIYEKLHPERQKRIQPIWLPDEEYIKSWERYEYEKKGFEENDPEFYTNKGERVRSKSEILIANALEKYEVPYHYEAPLDLKFHGIIHPDFTVLNVRLRKEYRWEHMGKMDDEGYCEYALNRILLYEMHGFFPGKELIFTHETLKKPINSKLIDEIILKYLK